MTERVLIEDTVTKASDMNADQTDEFQRVGEDYSERASRMKFGKMKLFCGSASGDLGAEIASYIASRDGYKNFRPGEYELTQFSNENIFIRLKESVRGRDVYLVQTMASPIHTSL